MKRSQALGHGIEDTDTLDVELCGYISIYSSQ